MYTILISCVIGLIVGIYLKIKDKDDFMPTPIILLFILLAGTFGFLIASFIGISKPSCKEVSTDTITLYSGYSMNNVQGTFFLLAGFISENNYVYYWKEYPDGKKVQEKQEMSKSSFYEEDRKDGKLKITNYNCGISDWGYLNYTFSTYEFHVPYGSIFTGYNIK